MVRERMGIAEFSGGVGTMYAVMAPAMSESSSITLPRHRWLRGLILLVAVYGLFAYVLMPAWWKWRERSNPAAAADPTLTSTATGIPGDPLNLSNETPWWPT